MENNKNLKFEDALNKLENILKKLESEDTPLDEMVDLYEKANQLADICREKLEVADKKMIKLSEDYKDGN
tara:strand:+ start:60 stop:269 length:210 start_codon:yes stop_codon:yes gene_type:complete